MIRLAPLLCALAACDAALEVDPAYLVDPPPGAELAIETVRQRIGAARRPVWWYGASSLDDPRCQDRAAFVERHWLSGSHVLCGTGVTDDNGTIIVWWGQRISDTALAHEIAHWRWANHDDPAVWGASSDDDHEPGTVVGDANAELAAMGL